MLTIVELKDALPSHLRTAATQDLVDNINTISTDPELAETIRNNFISYTNILKEGRFKTGDYLNAVVYVSFKMMGLTNAESYKRAFPVRHQLLVARGADDKEISAYVAAYNKNKLVNLLYEQTLVPTWVMNQDVYQRAIQVQADLMLTAKSEKVRSDAANSLLTHLKRPDSHKMVVSLDIKETDSMRELRDMLGSLAQRQQVMIGQGIQTRTIAHEQLVVKVSPVQALVEDAELVEDELEDVSVDPVSEVPAPKRPPFLFKSESNHTTPKHSPGSALTDFKPNVQGNSR
jgi:hypothetical protein